MEQKHLTYGEIPSFMQQALGQMYDSREIPSLAYMMAEECWGLSKGQMLLQRQDQLTAERMADLERVLNELKLGTPIQYILGNAWFYGHRFLVNTNVLIPRPETEELVQWVVEEVRGRRGEEAKGRSRHPERSRRTTGDAEQFRILDVGTGSGCIAISLKLEFPQAEVWAMDVSLPALETARYNAENLGADIRFILADIFEYSLAQLAKFDIIVSNPPYITTNEKALMRANVLEFEPEMALFVNDQEPLVFYGAIADFSLDHMTPGGKLFFEINEAFGKEVVELLERKGFTHVSLRKDMNGKDRMVLANGLKVNGVELP